MDMQNDTKIGVNMSPQKGYVDAVYIQLSLNLQQI